MTKTTNNEDELAKYAAQTEGVDSISNPEPPVQTMSEQKVEKIGRDEAYSKLKAEAEAKLAELNSKTNEQAHAEREAELQQWNRSRGNGFMPISVEDLPTKGMFYPVGTRIHIKAATLGDIRHWSASDETDFQSIDDALNSILESCCYVSFPESDARYANWKDLKEIDRFYVIIAIHDFTFPNDKNPLQVTVSENQHVQVMKDNIEFVKFSDKIMKFYNADKRCFTFPTKAKCLGGSLDIYIPNVGVTRWLKDYIQTKTQRQEPYDKDFIAISSLLIADYRGLNNDRYYELIDSTTDWTPYEWALISKVRSVIEGSVTPVLKYRDDGGTERETSLNFRGGIKAIFQPSLDIDL